MGNAQAPSEIIDKTFVFQGNHVKDNTLKGRRSQNHPPSNNQ
jgi:hypothetical protein